LRAIVQTFSNAVNKVEEQSRKSDVYSKGRSAWNNLEMSKYANVVI
jgi:hypothetical protein